MILHQRASRTLILALVILLAAPVLAAASGKTPSIEISIPFEWLAKSGGTITLGCETKADGDTAAMMRSLRGQGSRGRYEKRDGDDFMSATRNGDRFHLDTVGKDGGKLSLTMPWPVAECIFGGTGGRRQIRVQTLRDKGGFELKLDGEKGGVHMDVK